MFFNVSREKSGRPGYEASPSIQSFISVASPGGCMWVHMHPVHIPVHPLNYSFNLYQVLAVNSLCASFSCLQPRLHEALNPDWNPD